MAQTAEAPSTDERVQRFQERALAVGAGPSAPAVTVGWRGAVRASVGLPLALYTARPGWFVRLTPLIELYDVDGFNGFPYQYWRGLLGLEVGFRDVVILEPGPLSLSLSISLDHESDHETVHRLDDTGMLAARYSTFLFTNAVTLHGGAALRLPELSLAAEVTASMHVISCTRTEVACDRDLLDGAQSVSSAFDFVLRTGESDDLDRVQLCGALHAGVTASAARVVEEMRLQVQAGPCIRLRELGEWALLGQLTLGSRTGMQREEQGIHGGGALRWVP